MTFILTSDQEVPVSIAFDDDHGNPALVDGIPVWASTDDHILAVIAAADGMSAVVFSVGPVGQAQISVTGNANMDGSGFIPIIGLLDIKVVAGVAALAVLTPGVPSPWTSGP